MPQVGFSEKTRRVPLKEFRVQFVLSLLAASLFIYCCILEHENSLLKSKHDARIKSIRVPLRRDSYGYSWYADLTYGTPPQSLKTKFLPGLMDTWVLWSSYVSLHKGGYNDYLSTTSMRSDKLVDMLSYPGNISTGGLYGQDSLALTRNVMVRNQTAAWVVELPARSWHSDEAMRVGLWNKSPGGHKDLLENLVEQELIDEPVFSYHISRNTSKASSIQFGRPQERFYTGELFYVGLERSSWLAKPAGWFIRADSIRARGFYPAEVCSANCSRMYVDPNLDYIYGPAREVAILNRALGAQLDSTGNATYAYYKYPSCQEAYESPGVVFKFSGREFVLTAGDYVAQISTNACVSTILAQDGSDWSLGAPFMERYYTVFDRAQERIGFAPKTTDDDDNL